MHAENIAITGEGPDYFAEYKIKDLASEFALRRGTARGDVAVLDFGAGVGTSVPFVRRHFPRASITCLDVSTKSLEVGAARFAKEARFLRFDGTHIPASEGAFDVAFAACVFHHIDHAQHLPLLAELHRVSRDDGIVAIFEQNPYNPLTVRAVNTCPFDENARLIKAGVMRERMVRAGFRTASIRYRIFFPHVLRLLRPMEPALTWLPLGAQYYVVATK
jgi:ubiquinone/menaquinone biosynthesis C-methylase UbiE